MKRVFLFVVICLTSMFMAPAIMRADQTVTVTATSTDISQNLDLKTVATLFGQAKDLEQFEQMLNNPDSAFSNLDLSDGEVDYLRVIETADNNRHLVVIQAVLAKDIYQDVASIFVEKDEKNQVTVQVVGDEYIYGANYIIEPVYIYRPYIYDWFWGPSWVCWHSPYYWGYWPSWWHPFYCVDPFIYWDHCYWHHYHYPICSYRTGHHHRPHYASMRDRVRRNDFAQRHPERSFETRNASRNMSNAMSIDQTRRTSMREASALRGNVDRTANTRVNTSTTRGNAQTTRNATYGSSNVRNTATRGSVNRTSAVTTTRTQSATQRVATPSRSTSVRTNAVGTSRTNTVSTSRPQPSRTSVSTTAPSRSSSSAVRSSSTTSRSSNTSVRPSTPSTSRSTSSFPSGGGSRSGGGSSYRGGGSTRR
jgi:uncharacterized membrane protein YgcG